MPRTEKEMRELLQEKLIIQNRVHPDLVREMMSPDHPFNWIINAALSAMTHLSVQYETQQ